MANHKTDRRITPSTTVSVPSSVSLITTKNMDHLFIHVPNSSNRYRHQN